MRRASYKKLPLLIKYGEEFNGNSVAARYSKDGYVIYSYDTPIFTARAEDATFDNRFYSVTTSRIQNIIRRMLEAAQAGDEYVPGCYAERRVYRIPG